MCEFWLKQVDFLFHIVSKGGIFMDLIKVQDVLSWNAPTSVGDILSFLGLARYYRRFTEGFSKISKLSWFVTMIYSRGSHEIERMMVT
jgi:hypothetical protein